MFLYAVPYVSKAKTSVKNHKGIRKEKLSLNKTCRKPRWKSVVATEGIEVRLSWHFRVFAFFNGDISSEI